MARRNKQQQQHRFGGLREDLGPFLEYVEVSNVTCATFAKFIQNLDQDKTSRERGSGKGLVGGGGGGEGGITIC